MKATNIKFENNGKKKKIVENSVAVGYVGGSLTVHSPLFVFFFFHKVWLNKLMNCFYWSVR